MNNYMPRNWITWKKKEIPRYIQLTKTESWRNGQSQQTDKEGDSNRYQNLPAKESQ